jgi:hypothetical protein
MQSSPHLYVSLLVAQQFLFPVRTIGFGHVATFRTSMPKATVYKNSQTLSRKEKVGVTFDGFIAYLPTPNPPPDQARAKPELSSHI